MPILNFNATQVDPQSSFDPLPDGWYNVRITDSEMKPTKAGDGSYLNLTMEVIDGEFANRKLFNNLNLDNKNPVAVTIAQQELSAICHVTGILNVQDSMQLHGIPFQVRTKLRPARTDPATGVTYDASNEIKGYRDMQGNDPGKGAGAAAPAAPGAPAAPAAPAAPPAPVGPQRPTDPSHIHAAGTPGEQWWINGAWTPAVVAPPAPPAPPPAPAAAAPPAPTPAPTAPASPPSPPAAPTAPAAPATPPAAAPTAGANPPWIQNQQ